MQNGNVHSSNIGLEFEVVPENCIRNEYLVLSLGTPINQIICSLKSASRMIRNIELIYDNKEPFGRDIIIILKNDGIKLTFDPKQQLLKLIEVFDFRHITLHYCNNTFSTPESPADVAKVERCFGATHPGVYDEKLKTYLLHWRGVSFSFPAKEPSTVQPTYAHGLGSLNFSNSSLPLLEKMGIYCGESPTETRIPEVPVSTLCGNTYPICIETVNDEAGTIMGLKIVYVAEDPEVNVKKISELPQKHRVIMFGNSEQMVIAALGAPSKVFYKTEDKMLIQRDSESESVDSLDKPDIFYNYFTLGLDILLDFDNRKVTKFVIHNNLPGHFDFTEYIRPSFAIRWNNTRQEPFSSEPCVLYTEDKLENFRAAFFDENGSCNPVVVNRNEGENPFGSTFCYGNGQQVIVEVMDNSHIATVTIYEAYNHDWHGSRMSLDDEDDPY